MDFTLKFEAEDKPLRKFNTIGKLMDADPAQLLIKHWITTENLDRYDEIVRAGGRKQQGAVAGLWQHGYDARGSLPIYTPLEFNVAQRDGVPGIVQLSRFYRPGFAELAQMPDALYSLLVYDMVLQGLITGSSIGFMSLKRGKMLVQDETDKDIEYEYLVHEEWEHLETSFVAVPANPYALTNYLDDALKQGKAKPADIITLFGKPCTGCHNKSVQPPDAEDKSTQPGISQDDLLRGVAAALRKTNNPEEG